MLSAIKTTTSSLLADWERDAEQPPSAGELQTVIDSAGIPVAINNTTSTRVARGKGAPGDPRDYHYRPVPGAAVK